jgi:hypothetical protein
LGDVKYPWQIKDFVVRGAKFTNAADH